jgi:hypothetical protein
VADTRASQGSADALDEALAAALAQALCTHPEGGLKLTKCARLKRHRDAIVALRAQRWSWEQIAAMLAGAGLDLSPRTLRAAMAAPKKATQKPAFRGRGGDPGSDAGPDLAAKTKHPKAPPSAPTSAADAPTPGQRDHQLTEQRPTESGFFTIDMEDN